MGDPSTLSFSLVLVAALFRHLEGPKDIHKQTHMVTSLFLDTCTTLLATFKDTALFYVCKRTMSEMKSCISSILNMLKQYSQY